jgi:hypothetical protein
MAWCTQRPGRLWDGGRIQKRLRIRPAGEERPKAVPDLSREYALTTASRQGPYFSSWLEVEESVDCPSGCKSKVR